jgi:hypothetical protein
LREISYFLSGLSASAFSAGILFPLLMPTASVNDVIYGSIIEK